MLPLDLAEFGKLASYLGSFAIGAAFGAVLENAGFGDSRKLAAQFYLKDMTVLKVMFTGILTACLLIFLFAALGYLDVAQLFVNPTFLWPGIVGGLVMGVGFVIGGYCPGTSVVSMASLKLDGMLFFLGAIVGAGVFGETVSWFSEFWHGSHTERLLLSDAFGISVGASVVAVTALALVFFYAAERIEGRFGEPRRRWTWRLTSKWHLAAATGALVVAVLVWVLGQPTPEEKWTRLRPQYQALLDDRAVFIDPREYAKTWYDPAIKLETLDLRSAGEYEAFHLESSRRVTHDQLVDPALVATLDQLPPHGVVVLVADDEAAAVRAWQRLKAQGVVNLYILDRGIAGWQQVFPGAPRPTAEMIEAIPEGAFTPKIKLNTVARSAGVCG